MNTVTFTGLSATFDGVIDIIQSEPELNTDGNWQRVIRVVGTPSGTDGLAPVLGVFTVIGATKEAVSITSPELSF
jgi:hypothetical protein